MQLRYQAPVRDLILTLDDSGDQVTSITFASESDGAAAPGVPSAAVRQLLRELDAYFAGDVVDFSLSALSARPVTPFQRRVLDTVIAIPRGQTRTYGEVAEAAGSAKAARAVGQTMATNPFPVVIPCHRVVASNGGMGGYTGGLEIKRRLLQLEA